VGFQKGEMGGAVAWLAAEKAVLSIRQGGTAINDEFQIL
jgi:hypothetical protein